MTADLSIEELSAIYALEDTEKIGIHRLRTLVAHFQGARNAINAGLKELGRVDGIDRYVAERVHNTVVHDEHRLKARRVQEANIRMYHLLHPNYPARLREIPDAPILLYGVGVVKEADDQSIAVVGTRSSSKYGHQVARELTRELVKNGFTIVSGLARGIDTEAHQAALDAGGRTIAVLGSGLDEIYPKENTGLARDIAQQGSVCTEYYLGAAPDAPHFPERNRIISGLTMGTLVIEAGDKSGAILTALIALEQNREVFAVPGNINSHRSIGTNRLIKHGAKLVQAVDDILVELTGQLSLSLDERTKPPVPDLSEEEQQVFELLSEDPVHIDTLAEKLASPTGRILSVLLNLELREIAEQLPGKRFVRR